MIQKGSIFDDFSENLAILCSQIQRFQTFGDFRTKKYFRNPNKDMDFQDDYVVIFFE